MSYSDTQKHNGDFSKCTRRIARVSKLMGGVRRLCRWRQKRVAIFLSHVYAMSQYLSICPSFGSSVCFSTPKILVKFKWRHP